jgi:hypothetical protein
MSIISSLSIQHYHHPLLVSALSSNRFCVPLAWTSMKNMSDADIPYGQYDNGVPT